MDPYGGNLFRRYLGNLHTDRRQTLWEQRGRRTLSFGVLRIIFRFRSTEISKVCSVTHGGNFRKFITRDRMGIATCGFPRWNQLGRLRNICEIRRYRKKLTASDVAFFEKFRGEIAKIELSSKWAEPE
jgi:hypothetical protein